MIDQNKIQIGSVQYLVSRKFAGRQSAKEIILEKIVAAKPFAPLDRM